MGKQMFNDTASPNGKVSGGGGGPESVSGTNSSGNKVPDGVVKASGTENLRTKTETKRAEVGSASPSSGNKKPEGVQSFDDASV